jgi:PilZ domain
MDQHRRSERFRASFPVEIEPEGGVTLDMSGSGIAFDTTHEYHVGDELTVRIILGRRASPDSLDLRCRGRVVRVEKSERGFRVGASVEWNEEDGPPMVTMHE